MRLRAQAGFVLFAIVTATITEAQNTAVPEQPRQRQQFHANAAGTKPPAGIDRQSITPSPEGPQVASSLLEQPATPAQVQLSAGNLTVKADNSALSEILQNISAKTGMTVDGFSRDQRIFGSYGPAAPREVLSALLDGLGYNVMMVGSLGNGAPRSLTLTPRTSAAGTGNRSTPTTGQNNNNDDEDDSSQEPQDTPQPPRPEPNPPEANQPPEQQQQTPANPGQPGQVKTPQQMLQELQQMRQQQLQQQQQVTPQ